MDKVQRYYRTQLFEFIFFQTRIVVASGSEILFYNIRKSGNQGNGIETSEKLVSLAEGGLVEDLIEWDSGSGVVTNQSVVENVPTIWVIQPFWLERAIYTLIYAIIIMPAKTTEEANKKEPNEEERKSATELALLIWEGSLFFSCIS